MSADDDLKAAVNDLGVAANSAAAAIKTELDKIAGMSNDPTVVEAVGNIRAVTANLAAAAQSITNPPADPAPAPVPEEPTQ